ncbi:MAG: YbdK family carboxylate-amine ligase [Alphaproteobacteria bacterium]|nr:YbdK family carboxylate-amine ligase [Alphaproteobacteria bacterium]
MSVLPFQGGSHLTLGAEIEFQLIDPESLDLCGRAEDVLRLARRHSDRVTPEIFQSMVEINSNICETVTAIDADMSAHIAVLQEAARVSDVLLSTTGSHPTARYSERRIFENERYKKLLDRNQWIARRLMIFGLHIHLGMKDAETCILYNNFFLHFIPHLLALSASSPFWQGDATGLASCRATVFEAMPTGGHPCRFQNWRDFSDTCQALLASKAIHSHKDLWWDLRPSPDYGTLEIRVCDGVATMRETLAIVAFAHGLARWYENHVEQAPALVYELGSPPPMWLIRENKWRALRHGLGAEIVVGADGKNVPLAEDIRFWLKQVQPFSDALGDTKYLAGIHEILEKGASHARQQARFAKSGDLTDVISHNCDEFAFGAPLWPAESAAA